MAEQLLSEKSTQKKIVREDAAIRVEEAKGIAEAQKTINAMTANYLQHEAINAQLVMAKSPNYTTVYPCYFRCFLRGKLEDQSRYYCCAATPVAA